MPVHSGPDANAAQLCCPAHIRYARSRRAAFGTPAQCTSNFGYWHYQRGFSLLEVLVAFAILSLSLGVLLQAFSGGLRNAAISDDYTQATLYAESILAALGREALLTPGMEEGQINENFVWRTVVTPYQEEAIALNESAVQPYRIRVEVLWRDGGRAVTLETLRLAPVSDF